MANKRKRWNPIVLRFLLSMWEDLGERNFRKLESLGILKLPSKRQLDRMKAKTPSAEGCEPEAFDMCRDVVRTRTISYIINLITIIVVVVVFEYLLMYDLLLIIIIINMIVPTYRYYCTILN